MVIGEASILKICRLWGHCKGKYRHSALMMWTSSDQDDQSTNPFTNQNLGLWFLVLLFLIFTIIF